jgi:hypothetical protein
MPRKPIGDKAQTSAERQRAYRERLRAAGLRQAWVPDPDRVGAAPDAEPGDDDAGDLDDEPRAPRRSRPRRWAAAIEAVRTSTGDLAELKEEYEYWRDNLPDNQRDGILAEKLDETIAAVEAFEETLEAALDELANVDLPRGFGRD